MPQKCHVINCTNPVVSNSLCDKHRKRLARTGSLDESRPFDWGTREKHPAYRAWCSIKRYHYQNAPKHWLEDFWSFVKDVPEKPLEGKAYRIDHEKPWSPENFYWKEPRLSIQKRADHAAYMREWQKQIRAANPKYGKDSFLKRTYGIDLAWYEVQHDKQGGKCAICDQLETAQIRGKTLSLAVDHCHETGEIRGLLCRACNNAIGALRHDQRLLQKAIDYLQEPTTKAPENGA